MAQERIELGPQPGPQEKFLSSTADITIYGGAAGGGKTYGMLLETLRHCHNEKMGAVIFRRIYPQIRNEGGLWDESLKLYPIFGAMPHESRTEWLFPSGYKVKFSHMQHEKDRINWQGAQIPLIGFDELTQFTEKQFWYLVGRNRSVSGIPAYVRATCNPDPKSFVAKLIAWWIDEDGWPIEERSGVIRYFIRIDDKLIWADNPKTLTKKYTTKERKIIPLSLTFIPAKLTDNQILMKMDPAYQAKLDSLPYVERMRLKEGNWKVEPAAGLYFNRERIEIVDALPLMKSQTVRFWDRAATEKTETNSPDWTVGLKLGRDEDDQYYVIDIRRFQGSPLKVEKALKATATQDSINVKVGLEQEPGASGKAEIAYLIRRLSGFSVTAYPAQKDKVTRAGPVSSQAEAGNIKLLRGPWNEDFLSELDNFPEGEHDDQVDALSGAFHMITQDSTGEWTPNMNQSGETMAGPINQGDQW